MGVTPSWEHYGTHDDSAYPELWEGCVGAWAPGLQMSGDRFVDYANTGAGTIVLPKNAGDGYYTQSELSGYYIDARLSVTGHSDIPSAPRNAIGAGDFALVVEFMCDSFPVSSVQQRTLFSAGYQYLEMFVYDKGTSYPGLACYVGNGSSYSGHPVDYASSVTKTLAVEAGKRYIGWITRKAGSTLDMGISRKTISGTENKSIPAFGGIALGNRNVASQNLGHHGLIGSVSLYNRYVSLDEISLCIDLPKAMYTPRRSRRFYSFAGPAFLAAWAQQRNAQLLGGGLR